MDDCMNMDDSEHNFSIRILGKCFIKQKNAFLGGSRGYLTSEL